MLRRFIYAGLLLALVATPAVATHINEPTRPILDAKLRVLHYATKTVAACDGSVFPFRNVRLEQFVKFSNETKGGLAAADAPSEHFDALLRVEELTFDPFRVRLQWDVRWLHSNVPPHPVQGHGIGWWKTTGDHTNTWNLDPGTYRITSEVKGLESGNVFQQVCEFVVPAGASG